MTLTELCEAMGVTARTVRSWVKLGAPREPSGRGYTYDLAQFEQWLVSRGIRARTRDQIARYFNVGARTVAYWVAKGMPGKPGEYDLQAIATWREEQPRGNGGNDDKGREQREELRDLEIEIAKTKLARERARLIEVEPARRMLVRHIHEAKAILDQLPDRVLGVLPSRTKSGVRRAVRKRVAAAVDGAYTMLADSLGDLENQVREAES